MDGSKIYIIPLSMGIRVIDINTAARLYIRINPAKMSVNGMKKIIAGGMYEKDGVLREKYPHHEFIRLYLKVRIMHFFFHIMNVDNSPYSEA